MGRFELRDFGLNVPREVLAVSSEEAVQAARAFGGGVVALKVQSPDIVHKSDVGGVVLNLRGEREIREAFERILGNVKRLAPRARVEGMLVQEMVPSGSEVIIGLNNDPDFGPIIMLGLGGVFTDVFRDVAFRMLPITDEDAVDMVESLRSACVFRGYRGKPPVDRDTLVGLLLKISRLGLEVAPYLGSVDLNPVVLSGSDHWVVDAKILLKEETASPGLPTPDTSHLSNFFEARSVALVGATPTPGKIGYFVMDSLSRHQYDGIIYPVNPGREKVFGLRCYSSVAAVPDGLDLVAVTAPLEVVPSILEDCARKGCRNLVIISGGGKEIGGERAQIEREIKDLAESRGVRIVGCNCIGVFDSKSRLDTFFQTHDRMVRPCSGRVAMITQSGTVGAIFLEEMEHIGVSRFVSLGNRIDVDEADLLAYLADDSRTDVIAVYIEGFGSGRKFIRAARDVATQKSVIVFKAARTAEGATAAVSHTGFYGGSHEVAQGVFRQAGLITVDSVEELVAVSKAMACLRAAKGNKVAMISNGAGTAVQALDLLDAYGLSLARLGDATRRDLLARYPAFYQVANPIDITGSATERDYRLGIEALLDDPEVDVVMPWFVLQDSPLEDTIVSTVAELVSASSKPIVCGAAGGPWTRQVKTELEKKGVPLFGTVKEWVAAAKGLCSWRVQRR